MHTKTDTDTHTHTLKYACTNTHSNIRTGPCTNTPIHSNILTLTQQHTNLTHPLAPHTCIYIHRHACMHARNGHL